MDPKHCEDCGAMEQRGVYCPTCIPMTVTTCVACNNALHDCVCQPEDWSTEPPTMKRRMVPWRDMLPSCPRYGCTGVLICGYCNRCCNVDDLPEE